MKQENLIMLLVLLGVGAVLSAIPYYRRCVRPLLKGLKGERRVQDLLSKYEFEFAHDVYVPNGKGALAQIDILVKLQNSIAVFEVKNLSGEIDGTDYDGKWVQTINGRSWNIQNYHAQKERQVRHLKDMLPGVNIWGGVVFVGNGRLAHVDIQGVQTYEQFRNFLAGYKMKYKLHEHSREVEAAWLQILDQADQSTWSQRREHRRQLRKWYGRDWDRIFITARFAALSCAVIGVGAYVWQL